MQKFPKIIEQNIYFKILKNSDVFLKLKKYDLEYNSSNNMGQKCEGDCGLCFFFLNSFFFCLFFCNRGDTIQYHNGLWSRELGQAPMPLVFLTPRQALSSHPHQQMI